jgi:ABC-type transport system substrate-binding protein
VITFSHPYGEQLYDATYYVRVLPEHVWSAIPRAEWAADTALAHLVGSGPYALESWQRGTGLALVARPRAPANIPRILWRFAADQDAALNLVLSHEADLIETVVNPNQLARATGDSALRVERYPSAVYGFLGFRLDDRPGQPAAAGLRSEKVRQALALAIDRAAVVRNVFGAEAKTPPGPMSAMLWIWDEKIPHTGFDPAEANRLLDGEGWVRAGDGVRHKGGRALALDLLVPATSSARRQLAIAIQEMWRRVGVTASVSAVDFPVFQERLHTGRFDGYIGAWLDDPSPRGLADQWTRAGWPALNYGHYASARFDSLLTRASSLANPEAARAAWHEAIEVLNGDVPAVFLYTPVNAALVNRRVEGVTIDAYSWLHTLPQWKLRSE